MKGSLLEQLAAELGARNNGQMAGGFRATPSTPGTPYYTGPNSLFGVPGLNRDIISSRIQPMGLAGRLPAVASNVIYPYFAYITGFQAGTGSRPDGPCDDPPTAGPGKSCLQTAQFGRYSYQTRTLEINRVGQQINRGEMLDIRFMNNPLLDTSRGMGGLTVPNVPGTAGPREEMLMRMIELGVSFQNDLGRAIYEGNPANDTNGGYAEFPGLDILIGTNKRDALTGQLCTSLNSDIKDFNYARVDGGGDGEQIINVMSYLMRYLRYNAEHMNFGATTWDIVMRPELFWELTAVWPCSYLTYRCQALNGNQAIIDAGDAVEMRDRMRNESFLVVDGMRFDVIQDNMIREETNTTSNRVTSGCFASDIYVIPRTVMGGRPVTYWEYYDYRNGPVQAAEQARMSDYFWTDDGRYLWHRKPPTNWCVQLLAKIEPRIILLTPQLAGRITNVQYCPLQHTRDVLPSDPYHLNGGVTTGRPLTPLYSDWNNTVP